MQRGILLTVAGALLCGLLWAEGHGAGWPALGFKAPLSILFVITALLQARVIPRYFMFMISGLVLGLVGDVCLGLPGPLPFKIGLAAFLAGHVLYIVAFAIVAGGRSWVNAVNIVIMAASGAVYLWLLPYLGKMLVPVTLYLVVISGMVMAAWAAFRNPELGRKGAWFILAGAILFYLSDIFVARQRFVTEAFCNRLIGLPLYYTAQFLLALSVGMVKKE